MPAARKKPTAKKAAQKAAPESRAMSLADRLMEARRERMAFARFSQLDIRQETSELASRMTPDLVHQAFDEARNGDTRLMFALFRDVLVADGHILTELLKRKLNVLARGWSIKPWDRKNADDVAAAQHIDDQLANLRGLPQILGEFLHATIWPVVVLGKVYAPSQTAAYPYQLKSIFRVDDELIDYRSGSLRLFRVCDGKIDRAVSEPPDPIRHIVHRNHLVNVPDRFGGLMRSLVFWWLFTAMDRDWWVRFLDRWGMPFPVGKYARGDEESKAVLREAFSWATKLGGLVVDSETSVEIHALNASQGADGFQKFWDVAQREKSKIILGQTLSASADPTGLGSGTSNLQGAVMDTVAIADGMLLSEALRFDVFKPLLELNGVPGRPPQILFGALTSADRKTLSEVLKNLKDAGFEPTDDGLEKVIEEIGFSLQRNAGQTAGNDALGAAVASALAMDGLVSADAANLAVARGSSAALAQAFRGDLAALRRQISLSTSADDLAARLREAIPTISPERSRRVLEAALTAWSANASAIPFPVLGTTLDQPRTATTA